MRRLTRRGLLLGAGALAAGGTALVVSVPVARRAWAERRRARPLGGTAWLRIDADGQVTVFSHVGEMGQGAVTGLLQALADELDADWATIRHQPAPVEAPYEGRFGQYTSGSTSVREHFMPYRELGAKARLMLVRAAARRWAVDEDECLSESGTIVHAASGRRLGYGEVAVEAAQLRVPRTVALKPPSRWRYIGRSLPRTTLKAIVDGTALYGIDASVPGARMAAIRHCPVQHGSLRSVDEQPALRHPGVTDVVRLPDAVAVVASGYWQAQQAVDALEPLWNLGTAPAQSGDELSTLLDQLLEEAGVNGSSKPPAAAPPGARQVRAEYEVPLLAQAPLEPMNALADVRAGGARLWVSTQTPSACRQQVAAALGLPLDAVTIHPQLMGGAFGRRLQNDYAVEAALISRAARSPVKLIWSRQEDFLRTSLRPAAKARLQATLGKDGLPVVLLADVAALDTNPRTSGLQQLPYRIANPRIRYAGRSTAARLGNFRSVDLSQNIFFLESFIDECAQAAGQHPLEYRRALLGAGHGGTAVLDALAGLVNGQDEAAESSSLGFAYLEAYGSRIAVAVRIAAPSPTAFRVQAIYCVADCGLVVNPALAEAQVQGGLLQGLSTACHERIDLQRGRVNQTGFGDYRVLSMGETPRTEIRLLSHPDAAPGGVGELALPVVAPALANALAAATGHRHRTLPLA